MTLFGATDDADAVARAERGLTGASVEVLDGVPMPEDLDGLVVEAMGLPWDELPQGPTHHWEVGEAVVLPTRSELVEAVGSLRGDRLRDVAEQWEDHAVGWYGGADDIVEAVTILRDFLAGRAAAGQQVYAYISP